jgi:hypothetical protein
VVDYRKQANDYLIENTDLRCDLALLKAELVLERKQVSSLKLQIGLLKTEVAKWKRAHYYANKDRARIERQEIERVKEAQCEQDLTKEMSR